MKNYVPVTPEMLKNPPPGDWLIFRRNYHGHSYSPLDQITRDNVHDLKLAWVWAMNDTGANQTTPIVHNGIMYLASPSNIVQAIDGKTGNLIWETRVGPDQAPGYGGIRSIAIAQDKVFLPTSNAHIVALSARTGDILWDTPVSDINHPSTSGAIVIGDKILQGMTGCGRNAAADGCYISAIDINTGKRVWRFYTIPREGEPGFDTLGHPSERAASRRRDVDRGLLRSRFEPHLLGNRAVEAVVVSQSRHDAARQDAVFELHARIERRHGKAGVVLPARARRIVRSR